MESAHHDPDRLVPWRAGSPAVRAMPRVVGPGRRERAYQGECRRLESDLEAARAAWRAQSAETAQKERELALLERVERGCQRHLDRLEGKVAVAGQQKDRLILALGGLQRENELLRAELERLVLGASPIALEGERRRARAQAPALASAGQTDGGRRAGRARDSAPRKAWWHVFGASRSEARGARGRGPSAGGA